MLRHDVLALDAGKGPVVPGFEVAIGLVLIVPSLVMAAL
jgi:hypothetical protein